VYPNELELLDFQTCTRATGIVAPTGVSLLDGGVEGPTGAPFAIGLAGLDLTYIASDGQSTEIATAKQSMRGVQLSRSDGSFGLTAAMDGSTIGWLLTPVRQMLALRHEGASAAISSAKVIWVHDGLAEIHTFSNDNFAALARYPDPAAFNMAWSNSDSLVVGRYSGAYLIEHAAMHGAGRIVDLPLPKDAGGYLINRLAGAGAAPWAAAIVGDKGP
jgi:hypothetical protein